MSAQVIGNSIANTAEVEANTLALRTTLRPEDYVASSGGIFRLTGASGVLNAGITAASPIFSFRNSTTTLMLVKRVLLSAGDVAIMAAGACVFNMFVARSFTVSDSGGTSLLPTGNMNKLRTTGMATTVLGDVRIGSTGPVVAGTRTPDSQPVGTVVSGVLNVAGAVLVNPSTVIFDQRPGEHPLVLAQNEGFIIQCTVPATGTWALTVSVDWSELTSY